MRALSSAAFRLFFLASLALPQCSAPPAAAGGAESRPAAAPQDGDRQILWQRSLADALAIAKAEDRPLLLAVNMDGESASERIGRERYRDPKFVAWTRECVCVVASVFRHSPRDFDDEGRRIPCPRLGEITCGEHMALEPVLWEKYLSDGERVAPRHALILQDGKKAWDEALLFDLRDLDGLLRKAAKAEVERRVMEPGARAITAIELDESSWAALAARRDHRGRARLEETLSKAWREATMPPPEGFAPSLALAAIGEHGDAGALGALRVVCARGVTPGTPLGDEFVAVTGKLGLLPAVATILRQRVAGLGPRPDQLLPEGAEHALEILAAVDGTSPATRSLLLAAFATGLYGEHAEAAIRRAFGDEAPAILEAGTRARGSLGVAELLARAEAVTREVGGQSIPTRNAADQMPDEEALTRELAEVDALLRTSPDDPELLARQAKANLDLGRRHIESKQRDVALLLEDAARGFDRALALRPDRCVWWIERARTAYFQGRFAEQLEAGRRAFRLGAGCDLPAPEDVLTRALKDKDTVEALRWIGDANARLFGERAGKDPAVELRGMCEGFQALGLVAATPTADAKDWLSFASCLDALGLGRESLAAALHGARRLPASAELRQLNNDTLWGSGRIDLAGELADGLVAADPNWPESHWHAGYAWILVAENHRRCERADPAIQAYDAAQERFERALALRADFADSVRPNLAIAWLGRGAAHIIADRRDRAAECLVRGIATNPAVAASRDGLDREAVDLLDQILEWRESGPSPVDALGLLGQLESAEPGNPFWAIAVSDSELREALRADGRNPQRVERDTVDAEGKPVRMRLGLPTEEGDAYLQRSIEAGRRAQVQRDTSEGRHALAQALTIHGERMLERARIEEARRALYEAAPLLDFQLPEAEAPRPAIEELAHRLRAALGPARPRQRPGR